MHYVRQHRSVHLFVLRPVRAVQGGHIEIITLVAPALVKDLFEFFFRFEIHAQIDVQPPGAGLRWRAVGVNDEEGWRWGRTTHRPGPASAGTASGTIDKLVTIRADFVSQNAVRESSRPPITEPIADQFIPRTRCATPSTLSTRRRLKIVDSSVNAGL